MNLRNRLGIRAAKLFSSAVIASLGTSTASAVILYSTPTRNTAAPGGTLAGSGWQYEGQWGGLLGTPISTHYFITAQHFGGSVGGTFTYQAVNYTATEIHDDPNTDLRLVRVDKRFPSYAPLYTRKDEVGKSLVVFGRGTQRGAEVRLSTPPRQGEDTLRGWQWGPSDSVQSWGTNVVTGATGFPNDDQNQFLYFDFDANGGPNEGALSAGDSGGGTFIKDPSDGRWKLAGISYGVDGPWSYTGTTGSGFDGSLFDAGNMYVSNGNGFDFVPDAVANIPGSSYVTRISDALPFIYGFVPATASKKIGGPAIATSVPEPTSAFLLLVGAGALLSRRVRRGF